ncbi:tyrosine-type recombinase/integrase [Chloroflexota bacterium]
MDTPKFRLMVVLLIDTGLRIWEACSIRRNNINFERLEIKVMGKGRKERVVPISHLTAALLDAWIERCEDSEWLFPANNPQGYWHECSFERTIKRVCQRHGIKPITPHALRHFFATHNLKNGARLEVVSKILGHASTSITADIYVHVDRDDIHNTHRQFSPFAKLLLNQVELQPCMLAERD